MLGSRDVRVKPPKDFRLSDDWLRYVMKAFLLLSLSGSRESAILRRILRRSTEGVYRATDVECLECSAGHLEVEGARMSVKSSPLITDRDALELLTTARRFQRRVPVSEEARRAKQFFVVGKALEMPMQDAETSREREST